MIVKELPDDQFNMVVRWIKVGDVDFVRQIETMLSAAASRLRVKSKAKWAVPGVPPGGDDVNGGAVRDWLDRIMPGDGVAKSQIARLLATARVRLGG